MVVMSGMPLTASTKPRRNVCAYEKMCAYKKGELNNPSLQYALVTLLYLL